MGFMGLMRVVGGCRMRLGGYYGVHGVNESSGRLSDETRGVTMGFMGLMRVVGGCRMRLGGYYGVNEWWEAVG